MKKLKLWKILLIIGLLVTMVASLLLYFLSNDEDNNNSNDNKSLILQLLKKDYLISKALYDKIPVDEKGIVVGDVTYNHVKSKELSNLSDLHNIITNTYIDSNLYDVLSNIDKYNKYVELENELYVNINSVCSVKDFSDEVDIIEIDTNEIKAQSNGKDFKAIKDENGNYKLDISIYKCN